MGHRGRVRLIATSSLAGPYAAVWRRASVYMHTIIAAYGPRWSAGSARAATIYRNLTRRTACLSKNWDGKIKGAAKTSSVIIRISSPPLKMADILSPIMDREQDHGRSAGLEIGKKRRNIGRRGAPSSPVSNSSRSSKIQPANTIFPPNSYVVGLGAQPLLT